MAPRPIPVKSLHYIFGGVLSIGTPRLDGSVTSRSAQRRLGRVSFRAVSRSAGSGLGRATRRRRRVRPSAATRPGQSRCAACRPWRDGTREETSLPPRVQSTTPITNAMGQVLSTRPRAGTNYARRYRQGSSTPQIRPSIATIPPKLRNPGYCSIAAKVLGTAGGA